MGNPEKKGFFGKLEKFNKITRNIGIGMAIIGVIFGIPTLAVLGLTGAAADQALIELAKRRK